MTALNSSINWNNKIINVLTKWSIIFDPEIFASVDIYKIIKNTVQNDDNTFRYLFSRAYGLFLNTNMVSHLNDFFDLLRINRLTTSRTNSLSLFKTISKQLKTITGTNQNVFATKLVHTISDDFPIVDSRVCEFFGIKSNQIDSQLLQQIINIYSSIEKNAKTHIKKFKDTYKIKNNEISYAKIIDFCIWREMKP